MVALGRLRHLLRGGHPFLAAGDRSDFERGTLTNLSLRADGRLFLAPEFTEIFDSYHALSLDPGG